MSELGLQQLASALVYFTWRLVKALIGPLSSQDTFGRRRLVMVTWSIASASKAGLSKTSRKVLDLPMKRPL